MRGVASKLWLVGLVGLVGVGCNSSVEGGPPEMDADADADSDPDSDPDLDTSDTGPAASAFTAPFLWAPIPYEGAVDGRHVPRSIPETERVDASAVVLTEVGEEAGLATATAGGNSHGVGIGFFDANGDGWEDIFVASGSSFVTSLWTNDRDGTFSDATVTSGIASLVGGRDTYSVAAGDYDADGDVDIYLGAHPQSILLRNEGDGTFTDQTMAAQAGGPPSAEDLSGSSKIGAFGDVDGDGWLDIFVASSTFGASTSRNGYLLRNDRDGTFTDVSEAMALQISSQGNPCAVMWTDYDNDGDLDLNVWNDRGQSTSNRTLLRNDGDTLVDVTTAAGMTMFAGNPMGIDGADIDRDGFLDYYVSSIGGNPLLMAQGDGTFVDFSIAAGVRGEYGWGLGFEDLRRRRLVGHLRGPGRHSVPT